MFLPVMFNELGTEPFSFVGERIQDVAVTSALHKAVSSSFQFSLTLPTVSSQHLLLTPEIIPRTLIVLGNPVHALLSTDTGYVVNPRTFDAQHKPVSSRVPMLPEVPLVSAVHKAPSTKIFTIGINPVQHKLVSAQAKVTQPVQAQNSVHKLISLELVTNVNVIVTSSICKLLTQETVITPVPAVDSANHKLFSTIPTLGTSVVSYSALHKQHTGSVLGVPTTDTFSSEHKLLSSAIPLEYIPNVNSALHSLVSTPPLYGNTPIVMACGRYLNVEEEIRSLDTVEENRVLDTYKENRVLNSLKENRYLDTVKCA